MKFLIDALQGSDLSSMDLSEEEKIKAMMTQSTADYDPSHYVRIRGANQHGRVPDSYRCNKCNQGGHWISRCPNVPVRVLLMLFHKHTNPVYQIIIMCMMML